LRSLLWLATFSLLSGWLGMFIWFGTGYLLHMNIRSDSPFPFHSGLLDVLAIAIVPDAFLLPSVPIITGIAAVVRKRLGRLPGFMLGVIAMFTTAAFGMVLMGQRRGMLIGVIGLPKILGAVLLARVPFFRRKALELSSPSRFRGLRGTYAVSMDGGETASLSLGRRATGERRHALRRQERPVRWSSSFRGLTPAPRRVQGRAKLILFRDRSSIWAWAALCSGIAASVASIALERVSNPPHYEDGELARYGLLVVPLIALCLLRHALLHFHERARLLRLLRNGEVVEATPSKDALFDLRDAVISIGESRHGRVLVVTRPPAAASDVQGLLVGENGDVVAWDLLPFTPVVDDSGGIATG